MTIQNTLLGCSPTPLANYLKALGVLRLLAEQRPEAHPAARWNGDTFIIESALDADGLVAFFLNDYCPSPLVAPWNGGSGFYPKDNHVAFDKIFAATSPRFAAYKSTIAAAKTALQKIGGAEKSTDKTVKESLLRECRNLFPDSALAWLDAAFMLTDNGAKYPPLLGTGGNDGRLDFTTNFMQRLVDIFLSDKKAKKDTLNTADLLRAALFDQNVSGLADDAIGQFSPVAAGGANASTGFDSKSSLNPWDFILALEGALFFAAAAVRRLEGAAPGQLVYPFCVQSTGAGYGSAADADESNSRCEIWLPLWRQAANYAELRALFAEGRAWVGRRPAKNGVDFALAISALGVDRGIAEFQRYAFLVRNGLAYFAVPLQRLRVARNAVAIDLIAVADGWLQKFLRAAKSDRTPASIGRATHRLENALLAQTTAAQTGNTAAVSELLCAFGECERTLTVSATWRQASFVPPIPPLPITWLDAANDGSVEFRLAVALAALGVRRHLAPVADGKNGVFWTDKDKTDKEVAPANAALPEILRFIFGRRLLAAGKNKNGWAEFSKISARPDDLAAFIAGETDDARLLELLRGLALLDFAQPVKFSGAAPPADLPDTPPAFYAQLKLCFANSRSLPKAKVIPVEPLIFNLAAAGDGDRASAQALRRLRGSNVPCENIRIALTGEVVRRAAAALLFPLHSRELAAVGKMIAPDFFRSSV